MEDNKDVRAPVLFRPDIYEIQLQGHVTQDWSSWLRTAQSSHNDDGVTTVVGQVEDQAALHGVLARIRDLGLVLLLVKRLPQHTAPIL